MVYTKSLNYLIRAALQGFMLIFISWQELTHDVEGDLVVHKRHVDEQSGQHEERGVQVLDLRVLRDRRHHQVHGDEQHHVRDPDRHLQTITSKKSLIRGVEQH